MIRELPLREESLQGAWPTEGAPISTPDSRAPGSIEAAVATVRGRGFRMSSARRLVLEALFAANAPITAEQIARGLDGRLPRSDLGSVYRNLEILERLGVVRHLRGANGPGLYAIAREGEEGFLACERCGEVRPANPRAVVLIRAAVRKAFGYDASFRSFPIVGVCPRCKEEDAT
jgi:Fur family ferric uptake transcriptional regulator